MGLFLALLVGFVAGLASSVPIGPAEFWIVQALLLKKHKHISSFVLGIIVSDLIYAHLAYLGYFLYFHDTAIGFWMKIFSAFFLIFIGFYQLKFSPKYSLNEQQTEFKSDYKARAFLTGFIICASNPVFILFWLYVVSFLEQLGIEKNIWTMFLYYLGILIGDLVWYFIFVYYSKKGLQYFKSKHYQALVQLLNYSFIVFGVIALLKLVSWRSI